MFSLLSCQSKQHKKINVIDKTIKLNEEIEVKYPSINDSIDNLLLDNVKNTYNYIINNYDTIPNFSYQSYLNKKYISYLVNYKYLDKEMIQAYNYDLNNGKEIYFNISKIIEEINSNHNFNYNLNSLDQGFLNIIINNQNIDIYLSKYLTNKDIQTAVTAALPMNAIPFSQAGDRQLAEELESYKAILVENYIRSIQESLYSNS